MTTKSSGHSGVSDYVTGLQTRNELEACLQLQFNHNGSQLPALVVLGIDVVGLKHVNDTRGFLAGDTYLAAAAAKLIDATTHSQLQSRLGGDELTAIFLGSQALEHATTAKEKLLACPEPPQVRCGIVAAVANDTAALLIERLYTASRKA
jgi:diguanylate cyclase (GGDEF)-like protein